MEEEEKPRLTFPPGFGTFLPPRPKISGNVRPRPGTPTNLRMLHKRREEREAEGREKSKKRQRHRRCLRCHAATSLLRSLWRLQWVHGDTGPVKGSKESESSDGACKYGPGA